MRRTLLGGLAVVLAVGCRTAPQRPVQLQGEPIAIAWLAGTWTGEYWNGAGGRGGSLSFTLRGGSDNLYGDVTMLLPRREQVRAADPTDPRAMQVSWPRELQIEVIAVHADSIEGVLAPYVAPDCDCTVTTRFLGQVRGDRVAGTFQTRAGGRTLAEGEWELKRTGDAP